MHPSRKPDLGSIIEKLDPELDQIRIMNPGWELPDPDAPVKKTGSGSDHKIEHDLGSDQSRITDLGWDLPDPDTIVKRRVPGSELKTPDQEPTQTSGSGFKKVVKSFILVLSTPNFLFALT